MYTSRIQIIPAISLQFIHDSAISNNFLSIEPSLLIDVLSICTMHIAINIMAMEKTGILDPVAPFVCLESIISSLQKPISLFKELFSAFSFAFSNS